MVYKICILKMKTRNFIGTKCRSGMIINFLDVMQKLEVKVLYGQLTFKEQKNLIKLSEWSNQNFERIFGVKGFMESDF